MKMKRLILHVLRYKSQWVYKTFLFFLSAITFSDAQSAAIQVVELLQSEIGETKEVCSCEEGRVTLVVGPTGAGKSSLMNLLFPEKSLSYQTLDNGMVVLETIGPQIFKSGHNSVTSCTDKPQRWQHPQTKDIFYDCPGFEDTRTKVMGYYTVPLQEIRNVFFMGHMMKMITHMRVLFFVTYHSLDTKTIPLRRAVETLNAHFPIEDYKEYIGLVINKCESQHKTVKATLEKIMESERKREGGLFDFTEAVLGSKDGLATVREFEPEDDESAKSYSLESSELAQFKQTVEQLPFCTRRPSTEMQLNFSDSVKLFLRQISSDIVDENKQLWEEFGDSIVKLQAFKKMDPDETDIKELQMFSDYLTFYKSIGNNTSLQLLKRIRTLSFINSNRILLSQLDKLEKYYTSIDFLSTTLNVSEVSESFWDDSINLVYSKTEPILSKYWIAHSKKVETLAQNGDVKSQFSLGLCYDGLGEYAKAFEWYKKAADKKNIAAYYHLGLLYESGKGVTPNMEEANSFIWKAADQSYVPAFDWVKQRAQIEDFNAQYYLGTMYESGRGVDKIDKKVACSWHERAAKQWHLHALKWLIQEATAGYFLAQYYLGTMYESGKGVPVDITKACELMIKAAEQNYTPAYEWIKKSEQKEAKEYAVACCYLGTMYESVKGVPMDITKACTLMIRAAGQNHTPAFEWIKKSEEKKNPYYKKAWYYLGTLYMQEGKTAKACTLMTKAADQNHTPAYEWIKESEQKEAKEYAVAWHCLAWMYENGVGVQKNDTKAFDLYMRCAKIGLLLSQYHLGLLYESGVGVQQKDTKALDLRAANTGTSEAQIDVCLLSEDESGISNIKESNEWIWKAAQQGCLDACKWIQQRATKGDDIAQYHLGLMYEKGVWYDRSEKTASMWYKMSAKHGNQDAQERYDILNPLCPCCAVS